MTQLDRIIHEPVRLRIMSILSGVDRADFKFMLATLGLSKGNLSSHVDKLEKAGYVEIEKEFRGKKPHSTVHLTDQGRAAFREYKKSMKQVLDDLPD